MYLPESVKAVQAVQIFVFPNVLRVFSCAESSENVIRFGQESVQAPEKFRLWEVEVSKTRFPSRFPGDLASIGKMRMH